MTESYGDWVVRMREERGMSQQDLIRKSGVKRRTIQAVESGETANPQKPTRNKIERALGVRGTNDTREGWDPDVSAYVNIYGAWLQELAPEQRARVNTEIVKMIEAQQARR